VPNPATGCPAAHGTVNGIAPCIVRGTAPGIRFELILPVNNSSVSTGIKIGAWYDQAASEFIVWAPLRSKVELVLSAPVPAVYPMEKDEFGYWRVSIATVAAGARYVFRLDGEVTCPDPASLAQPDGVHGPSELINRSIYRQRDEGWTGIPLSNQIIYELHTGAFSLTHNFDGVGEKLDYLVDLGINAIELMPLAQFPGSRNWGYDGVYPFAIQHTYGGVAGFRRLVDAAHAKGIAVIVDVVYNHFGPEGNYLDQYGPYFTDKYRTPWGKAVNFDDAWSDGVRNYFLQNAAMWLDDYGVDALRLDAVHAICDFSAIPFVQQLKELAAEIERRTGCPKVLIAEMDLNDPRYINPPVRGGYGLDGQWVDEFHHALRTLLTGDRKAYYQDFGQIGQLEKAFRHTYVYNGNYSPYRKRTFGGHADHNPYDQFVVFAQNHDQVGNRAMGERLTGILSFEQLKLAAAAVLLSPYIPLLFMGEEYGEEKPFQFFVSFSDEQLIESVRKGRAAEFKEFSGGGDPSVGTGAVPDPQAEETFAGSVLSWSYGQESGARLLRYYKHLISLRKTRPALQGRARDTMIVYPAIGQTLPLERKILNDQVYIWLHFGGEAVQLENGTGEALLKIFDSAALDWGGPGEIAGQEILAGQPIDIAPNSVIVYEKRN
jgi:maltooligosyltrehalose trehalohydrolase